MTEKRYPCFIDIYKGENRLLIIPCVRHVAGFSVHSDWFKIINEVNDYKKDR